MALDQDTLNQLLDTLTRFVRERLRPLEAQIAADDKIPDEVIQEMKDLGLFGLTVPEEYGGLGLTMSEEWRWPAFLDAPRPRSEVPLAPTSASGPSPSLSMARLNKKRTTYPKWQPVRSSAHFA